MVILRWGCNLLTPYTHCSSQEPVLFTSPGRSARYCDKYACLSVHSRYAKTDQVSADADGPRDAMRTLNRLSCCTQPGRWVWSTGGGRRSTVYSTWQRSTCHNEIFLTPTFGQKLQRKHVPYFWISKNFLITSCRINRETMPLDRCSHSDTTLARDAEAET